MFLLRVFSLVLVRFGLSNQLFDISVALARSCDHQYHLHIPFIWLDLTNSVTGSLNKFLNISATNKYTPCASLISPLSLNYEIRTGYLHDLPGIRQNGGWNYEGRDNIIKHLVLSGVNQDYEWNGIHLRLEMDVRIWFNHRDKYIEWLNLKRLEDSRSKLIEMEIEQDHLVRKWVDCMLDETIKEARLVDNGLPFRVASGVFFESNGLSKHIVNRLSSELGVDWSKLSNHVNREEQALSDMKMMIGSVHFIGSKDSTFTHIIKVKRDLDHPTREVDPFSCMLDRHYEKYDRYEIKMM